MTVYLQAETDSYHYDPMTTCEWENHARLLCKTGFTTTTTTKNYVHNLGSVSGIAITFSLTLMKVDLTLEDIH